MSSPHSPYLVCATPRSGSTLLCELLGDTGVPQSAEGFEQRLRDAFRDGAT